MKILKKIIKVLVMLGILALDWAALHDILQGEPNPYLEYLVLVLSFIYFVLVGIQLRKKEKSM